MLPEYDIDNEAEGTVLDHNNQVEFDIGEDLLSAMLWRAINIMVKYSDNKEITFSDDLSILELYKTEHGFVIHYVCGSDNEYDRLLSVKCKYDDKTSIWAIFECTDGVATDVFALEDINVTEAIDYSLLLHMTKYVSVLKFFDNLPDSNF